MRDIGFMLVPCTLIFSLFIRVSYDLELIHKGLYDLGLVVSCALLLIAVLLIVLGDERI